VYDVTKPEGAFYLFPRAPIEDDVAFVKAFQEENILVVPERGFAGGAFQDILQCITKNY